MKQNSNNLSRRTFVSTLGAGAIALSAPMIMTRAAHGKAEMLGVTENVFHRFKLGSYEVTVINDGMSVREGPHPLFAPKQNHLLGRTPKT